MFNKHVIYNIFFSFFLFITFDSAAQTMEVIVSEEDDEKNKLLSSKTNELTAKQKLWETISLQTEREDSESSSAEEVYKNSDMDLESIIQQDNPDEILHNTLLNNIQSEETNTRLTPKNWKEILATTCALSSLLPSGILMSGFGNLSMFLFIHGITPVNKTLLTNPTHDSIPSAPFRPVSVDPNHTYQTIFLAIPPCLTQALLVYHGTDWLIVYASKLKKRKFNIDSLCKRCFCEPKGFRRTVLDIAYSLPIRAVETIVHGGFLFNMIASQVKHVKGFGGGNEWALILASCSVPASLYLFGSLYTNSKNSPLYPRTNIQEGVLEELTILSYVAENETIFENRELEEFNNSLENSSTVNEERRKTIRQNLTQATNKQYPKIWNNTKDALALGSSLAIQLVNLPLNCWIVYSLTNKLCWAAGVSEEFAQTAATSTTAGFATPLIFGVLRDVEATYNTAKLFLNGFRPEISGYWGQRIPPVLAVGFCVFYISPSTTFSYQREIMFNPYGGTCTNDSNSNCTGSYYGNLQTTTRFAIASLYTAGTLFTAGVNWFLHPIEQTAHWAVTKLANIFDRGEPTPTYSKKQLMALNLVKKLRNFKLGAANWEDPELAGTT